MEVGWARRAGGWYWTGCPVLAICRQLYQCVTRGPPRVSTPWAGRADPRWAGGWACTRHPGVLGSIPKREEPGKIGAPCVKALRSLRVPVRDGQTSPHKQRLVVSHSTRPPLSSSPHANSFVIGTAVINNNTVAGPGPARDSSPKREREREKS